MEKITIGYDIYEKQEVYNQDEYYTYTEDQDGKLYKIHYGTEGEDWYITAFENLETGYFSDGVHGNLIYYKHIGRVPFKYLKVYNLADFLGKPLEKTTYDGEIRYGFMDYKDNAFYLINHVDEIAVFGQ